VTLLDKLLETRETVDIPTAWRLVNGLPLDSKAGRAQAYVAAKNGSLPGVIRLGPRRMVVSLRKLKAELDARPN